MTIFKQFTFDAAHFLPNVPDGHRCGNVHGHTYKMTLFISGNLQADLGWVMDFAVIKQATVDILSEVDHKLLNDVEGLRNPTCENLVVWLWNRIKTAIPMLEKIELYETPTSGAIYSGN